MRAPSQRTGGRHEQRTLGADCKSTSRIDRQLRRVFTATVFLTGLLVAPSATALRYADGGRSVAPLEFVGQLGYGNHGGPVAPWRWRLISPGYLTRAPGARSVAPTRTCARNRSTPPGAAGR